ncbi:12878_t:CDS:2 [Ambispora gerdemannii]|uniref:12878_t:CDS:1 n=1 Tax=Ambispora gerdemannii TaxID=144530 RepID=A0A9N9CFM6_9GLOM|nr:12878_t:CDS:2 [Ambispora gerdemannii]
MKESEILSLSKNHNDSVDVLAIRIEEYDTDIRESFPRRNTETSQQHSPSNRKKIILGLMLFTTSYLSSYLLFKIIILIANSIRKYSLLVRILLSLFLSFELFQRAIFVIFGAMLSQPTLFRKLLIVCTLFIAKEDIPHYNDYLANKYLASCVDILSMVINALAIVASIVGTLDTDHCDEEVNCGSDFSMIRIVAIALTLKCPLLLIMHSYESLDSWVAAVDKSINSKKIKEFLEKHSTSQHQRI